MISIIILIISLIILNQMVNRQKKVESEESSTKTRKLLTIYTLIFSFIFAISFCLTILTPFIISGGRNTIEENHQKNNLKFKEKIKVENLKVSKIYDKGKDAYFYISFSRGENCPEESYECLRKDVMIQKIDGSSSFISTYEIKKNNGHFNPFVYKILTFNFFGEHNFGLTQSRICIGKNDKTFGKMIENEVEQNDENWNTDSGQQPTTKVVDLQ